MAHAVTPPGSPTSAFAIDWRAIERGLPLSAIDEFSRWSGISMKELFEVVIPLRTLKHRRQRHEALSLEESDRLGRVARIHALALRVYDDKDDARDWLLAPRDRFDGKTALSMLRSTAGERAVEQFLYQIDDGMFV